MIDTALAAVFWVSAGLVVYGYALYPVLIACFARWFGRTGSPPEAADDALPTVTVLIAAHNEEAVLDERLRNALATDYPADRFEVVIGSDGSTDRTAEIARRYADRGVRLLDFPQNRGKATVLNAAMREATGQVVVLSDANTHFQPDAVRRMVRWFHDPGVGAVCGRLVLTDPKTGRNVDSLYWRYETFLKKQEGRLGALLGSNGAIYAIRRREYVPIPDGTIVDDFVIPLLGRLRSGRSVVYEPEAVALEESAPDVGNEFRRRARIGAGGFQAIGLLRGLVHPRHGWVAFTFLSHKIVRWFCPFFLAAALASSALLWRHPLYRAMFLLQALFYATSAVLMVAPAELRVLRHLRLTTMFTGMNLALLVGFWRWMLGTQGGTWRRTARLGELTECPNPASS